MKKQKKLVSLPPVSMAFIAAMIFFPGLVQSFYFPPAPEYQIGTIINELENLVKKGMLSEGQASTLNTIVKDAQKTILSEGDAAIACGLLQNFISQIQAYIHAGTLPAAKGKFLIDSANDVIIQLR